MISRPDLYTLMPSLEPPVTRDSQLVLVAAFWNQPRQGRKGNESPTPSTIPSRPPPLLIFPHIAHELRLQLLRTPFSAYRKRPFLSNESLVPGRQMQHRSLVIPK